MSNEKSFPDFLTQVETTLGRKADPDRAYEAFLAGVSAETFARLHGDSVKPLNEESTEESAEPAAVDQVPVSSFTPAPSSESFKLRKSTEGAASEASAYLKASRTFDYTLGAIALGLLASVWFFCSGGFGSVFYTGPSSRNGSEDQLHLAKVSLRQAIESENPETLQGALSRAKLLAIGNDDEDLRRLIVDGQKVFIPLEEAWKRKKKASLIREESRIASSLQAATREKSFARLSGAMQESEDFKLAHGAVSPEHAKARAGAMVVLGRLKVEEVKKAMNQYEGAPVAVAVGKIEVRRSFDGYSFDGNGRFVSVYVSVLNTGEASEHINPTNFTLATEDGYTVPYSAHTFSTGRPLNAVNIGRGATTAGWIVFESALSKRYKLIHEPLTGGGRVEKVLVP